MRVERVGAALGAEISGMDLGRPPGEDELAQLRAALAEHLVVFFRDQHLEPPELAAFASTLGPLLRVPYVDPMPGHPEIIEVRIHWRPGSVAVWDNRATLHLAVNDYDGHRRVLHRTTVGGDPPRPAAGAPP